MYLAGFTSINKWVKALKETPRYAYLSGFVPDKTPCKAYFTWFTSMRFGNEGDVDDVLSQGLLLRKIFEFVFVKASIECGIIVPNEKVVFDGCKVQVLLQTEIRP